MTNNQDTGYINQAGQNYFDSFIFYFLKIGICLFLVSWYLVIQAPLAHAGAIIGRPLYLGLEQGLVGFWSFDGQDMAGNTAFDRSGQGNNGTLTSGAKQIGRIGQALELDGNNNHVNLGNPPVLRFTSSFSISAWAKADTFPNTDSDIVNKFSGGIDGYVFTVSKDNVRPQLLFYLGTNSNSGRYSSQTIVPGSWYHFVGVYNSQQQTLDVYINGARDNEDLIAPVPASIVDSGTDAAIGDDFDFGFRTWDGLIDEVRIYNRALSPDEIRRLYNMGATFKINKPSGAGLEQGLVGYWTFDGQHMGTTSVHDISGQNNTGWLINGPRKVAGKLGQALDFDGVNDYVRSGLGAAATQTEYTWSAWIYPKQIAEGGLVGYGSSAGGNFIDGLTIDSSGSVILWLDGFALTSNNVLSTNNWYHIVGTMSQTVNATTIYINGSLDVSGASAVWDAEGCTLLIGAEDTGSGCNSSLAEFTGLIDDVRIYNRALSPQEIKRLYNLGGTFKIGIASAEGSLSDGLVGWWTFDGKDMYQNTAIDKSGQGNHGILTNGPKRVIGRIGQALEFDGVNNNYVIQSPIAASLTNLGPMSVSAWIRPRSAGSGDCGMVTGTAHSLGVPVGGWRLSFYDCEFGDLNSLVFEFDFSGATDLRITTEDNALVLHEWQHVALSWDGSGTANNVRIFINGIEPSRGTNQNGAGSKVTDSGKDFLIGIDASDTNDFDGTIDDVRIYNRALSLDEIKRLYNMGR
jgi:hypothetical protein